MRDELTVMDWMKTLDDLSLDFGTAMDNDDIPEAITILEEMLDIIHSNHIIAPNVEREATAALLELKLGQQ